MEKDNRVRAVRQEDEIDLRELLGVVYDRKWLIIGITVLFAVISVAYVMLAAPVYQAQAMIQVESKVPAMPGLSDLTSLTGGGSSAATTEVALLTSRTVVGTAVDRLQLDVSVVPRRFPLLGGYIARRFESQLPDGLAGPALGLSSYGWGGDALKIHSLGRLSGRTARRGSVRKKISSLLVLIFRWKRLRLGLCDCRRAGGARAAPGHLLGGAR